MTICFHHVPFRTYMECHHHRSSTCAWFKLVVSIRHLSSCGLWNVWTPHDWCDIRHYNLIFGYYWSTFLKFLGVILNCLFWNLRSANDGKRFPYILNIFDMNWPCRWHLSIFPVFSWSRDKGICNLVCTPGVTQRTNHGATLQMESLRLLCNNWEPQ